MRRNSIICPGQLAAESLARSLSPTDLRKEWIALLGATEAALWALPAADLGCIYLDEGGQVVHSPRPERLDSMLRHFGSVGGSWPRIVP